MNMNTENTHAERMLDGLRQVSGYIEDVAKHMIAMARHRGEAIECTYGNVLLRADANSTVAEVRAPFDRDGYERVSASSGWKQYLRQQLIEKRMSLGSGTRPMRALFSPGGLLEREAEAY